MTKNRVGLVLCALAFGSTLTCSNLPGQRPASAPIEASGQVNKPVGPALTIDDAPFQVPQAIPPFVSGPKQKNNGVNLKESFDGVDYLTSGLWYPPDTNVAVGNNYVLETVNKQVRIFDKRTGTVLLDEPLGLVFGNAFTRGDPYAVYDDNADRWYITALDDVNVIGGGGVYLAISYTGNPLLGFQTFHLPNDKASAGETYSDYPKMGFNRDAIFISYNGIFTGKLIIASIDKAAALSGTLSFSYSDRQQHRAMPPAQMHGDTTGGVEWFVSTNGSDREGSEILVTKMTNYSNTVNPVFEETPLSVMPYKNAPSALQPGGTITTSPNTTTTQVQYHDGHLVTAMASSVAADGYAFPKGLYYEVIVDETSKPMLLREGIIDPGPGVAVQMPSVDEDEHGNLGFTWMESSATEYLSMWVGTLTKNGRFASEDVAPGEGFFYVSNRIGDYSSVVLDPNDKTFWSANEYIGSDGASDIWRTHISSFSAK